MPAKPSSSTDLAEQAYRQADFMAVEQIYQERLKQQETALGGKHIEVASTLYGLGSLYYTLADYSKAEQCYTKAKDIFEEILGVEHPNVAISLRKLAKICQLRGNEIDSARLNQRALQIWHAYINSVDPEFKQEVNDFSELFNQLPLEEKIPLLPKLLKGCASKPSLAGTPLNIAALYELGVLYQERQHYKVAQQSLNFAQAELVVGNNPLLSLSILKHLAQLHACLGHSEDAEKICQEILAILPKHDMQEHPKAAIILQLLAQIALGREAYEKAEELNTKSLEILDKTLDSEHPCRIKSLQALGHLHVRNKNYSKAENNYKEAASILANAFGQTYIGIASINNHLANLYLQQSQYEEAESMSCAAIDIAGAAIGSQPPILANLYDTLASIYRKKEQYQKAEFAYQRSLKIRQQLALPARESLVTTMLALSNFYLDWDKYSEAEKYYKSSLSLLEELDHQPNNLLANCLAGLGIVYCQQGHWQQAEKTLKQALDIDQNSASAPDPQPLLSSDLTDGLGFGDAVISDRPIFPRLLVLINLAKISIARNKFQEAASSYNQAIDYLRQSFGESSVKIAPILNLKAELALKQNDLKGAITIFEQAVRLAKSSPEPDYASLVVAFCGMGDSYEQQRLKQESADSFAQALAVTKQGFALKTDGLIRTFNRLAKHCQNVGHSAEALTYFKQALSLGKQILGNNHILVAATQCQIAEFYGKEEQFAKAAEFYIRAMQIMDATLDPMHPELGSALIGLANIYISQGNISAAKPLTERGNRIRAHCFGPSSFNRTS